MAGGCGSSTGTNTITLTQDEVAEVYSEMAAALGGTGVSMDRAPAISLWGARAPTGTTNAATSISVTANCSGGGTVGVSGNVNPTTSGASFNLTETANACQTVRFTVGGSLNVSGSASSTSTAVTFNETVKGSFNVTRKADGASGSCSVDFSVNGSVDLNGGSSTITAQGTICGVNASAVVTT